MYKEWIDLCVYGKGVPEMDEIFLTRLLTVMLAAGCAARSSELGVARYAWEGYHVADVLHAGHEEHQPFKTKSEACMRC